MLHLLHRSTPCIQLSDFTVDTFELKNTWVFNSNYSQVRSLLFASVTALSYTSLVVPSNPSAVRRVMNDEREACLSFYGAIYYLSRNRLCTGQSYIWLATSRTHTHAEHMLNIYGVICTLEKYSNPLVTLLINVSINHSAHMFIWGNI